MDDRHHESPWRVLLGFGKCKRAQRERVVKWHWTGDYKRSKAVTIIAEMQLNVIVVAWLTIFKRRESATPLEPFSQYKSFVITQFENKGKLATKFSSTPRPRNGYWDRERRQNFTTTLQMTLSERCIVNLSTRK